MNGLDDLRRTLDERASDLLDHELGARPTAVHHRVAAVRRRRRAAAASGLVAAVAVAAGVTLAIGNAHSHGEAGLATIVGVPAPDHLDSLGYTYRFDQGVDGHDGKAVVRLPASDQPRLVSWATSGDDQAVTVDGPVLAGDTDFDVADFATFTLVPAGDVSTVRVTAAQGQPGLAVYVLDDARPTGVTQDGVTFRQDVAGGHLLGAVAGVAGQADLTVPATATGPGVSFRYFCSGGPHDAYLHLDYVDHAKGGFVEGGGCDDTVPVDAADASSATGFATHAGEDVSVRYYVTDGAHGPVVDDPDLRLGLGAYALDADPTGPDEYTPATLEDGGHLWTRVAVVTAQPGQRRIATIAPSGRGPVLAVLFGTGRAGHDVSLSSTLGGSAGTGLGGGGATRQVMTAGAPATARVDAGVPEPGTTYGLAFYVATD